MRIRIYQIAPELNSDHRMFQGLDEAHKSAPIHSECYECVYEKDLPAVDLEMVYQMFNIHLPEDYHGRSMSVSDVVEFEKDGQSQFLFCDTFGFSLVSFDKSKVHETAESRKQK